MGKEAQKEKQVHLEGKMTTLKTKNMEILRDGWGQLMIYEVHWINKKIPMLKVER